MDRPPGGSPHLQRSIGYAEPPSRKSEIAVLLTDDDTHGHVGGSLADLLQSGARCHGMADTAFELGIAPPTLDCFGWTLFFRNIADRDGPGTDMPTADACNQLAEIAHITWIAPIEHEFPHGAFEVDHANIGPKHLEEMPRERQNILATFAQWRHPKDPAGNPVIEVVAEFAACYGALQVLVGSADQPECGAVPRIASYALVCTLLDDPQQLGLKEHRQLSDFVEKQRSAVRQGERPVARGDCASECSPFVPEELTAGELGDDRRAVQDHEAAVCDAYVEFMNQTSYQLLTGPLSPIRSTEASVNRATSTT